jgi:hypothetical protein
VYTFACNTPLPLTTPLTTPPPNLRVCPHPQVKKCLSIKGAEDAINKPHAFEVSTTDCSMFFIADSDKVCVCGGGGCWGGREWVWAAV